VFKKFFRVFGRMVKIANVGESIKSFGDSAGVDLWSPVFGLFEERERESKTL